MNKQYVHLHCWLIDMSSGELRSFASSLEQSLEQDIESRIDPKGLNILSLLLDNYQSIVSKQTLLDTVWPDTVVSEDALTRSISRLRKSLLDNAKQSPLIETIPKRGYRLVAKPFEILELNADISKPAINSPASSAQKPFLNAQENHADSYTRRHKFLNKRVGVGLFGALLMISLIVGILLNDKFEPTNEQESFVLDQADDYYFRIRRQDNEMAIELYQQYMALRPNSGLGQAGLANAIVQQVVRWPNDPSSPDLLVKDLQHAFELGHLQNEEAKQRLQRALALAQQAVASSSDKARAYKSLGFVQSALGEFDLALEAYQKAVSFDNKAWDALLNIGDIKSIQGNTKQAIFYFEQAFDAMTQSYSQQSARVSPWYADFGAVIGDKYKEIERFEDAEKWYRHVLSFSPFNKNATVGLAELLYQFNEEASALSLCENYERRMGEKVC